jgi:hypothetical protein
VTQRVRSAVRPSGHASDAGPDDGESNFQDGGLSQVARHCDSQGREEDRMNIASLLVKSSQAFPDVVALAKSEAPHPTFRHSARWRRPRNLFSDPSKPAEVS